MKISQKVKRDIAELKKFCSRKVLLAGAITAAFMFSLGLLSPGHTHMYQLILWTLMSGIGGMAVASCRISYMELLKQRAETENDIVCDVQVNDVKVGTIKDSEYAMIRQKIFRDPHTYGEQILQFVMAVLRAMNMLLWGIPIVAFWLVVGSEVLDPGTFNATIVAFQKASPAQIHEALVTGANMLEMVFGLFFMISIAVGQRFGFNNCFAAETAKKLRLHCDASADGNVCLVRRVDGAAYFSDESKLFRMHQRNSRQRQTEDI